MKQLFVACLLLIGSICHSMTDPFGRISGTVMDGELNEPIPYATVVINDLEGNLVTGITSDDNGSFSIENIKSGVYVFKIQFIGYKTYTKEIHIDRNSQKIDLGTIRLEPDVAMLDETVVVAERTTIEQRVDRKIINVGKDLMTTGASASELMQNVPSVNVDQDGNISLRGNSNVRILVDGKPTNMDPAQLLKQIPSTSIKSIELITNPSAKYNPEGMSGIINIVLHKNANQGFNGNLNTGLTQGVNTRFNGSLDMNYRTGKFNFYGNLGGNFGKRQNEGTINLPESNSQQHFKAQNRRESYLYKIGIDYYMDEKNTLSVYTNQNLYEGGPLAYLEFTDFGDASNSFRQNLDANFDNTNSSYNLLFDHDFNDDGHDLQVELDFNNFDEEERTNVDFGENSFDFVPYTDIVNENRQNFTGNIDYVNPFSEVSKLELGAEARILTTDNDYDAGNPQLSDAQYEYNRDIYSFYTTFGQNYEKWSYQLGARLESYNVDAYYDGDEVYQDDYITVYPSAFVSYNQSEKNTFQLSYSRRVDRPGFSQVNPIRQVASPRLTVAGNPELDPQFTNSLEFNFTRKLGKKGSLTSGVFYRRTNDQINQIFQEVENEPGSIFLTFANYGDTNSYGTEFSLNYKFFDWWSTNSGLEIYHNTLQGAVGGEIIEVDNTAYTFRSSHNFKASEALSFSLFGMYRSKQQDLQLDIDDFYFVNVGARYSFLEDNKATVSLNFNDVFNTQKFRINGGRPFAQNGEFNNETQTVYLGFSYRFGGGKNRALKRKQRDDDNSGGGGLF
ncbi:outer membrane beta-barrel family protein [Christiangramia flava]|uniref:TonB-dependent receptor, putative n=1 Tax=Christiangramia flava JLT2011 TaxID=1229726 RepID=A0A1L7I6P8_9FLAO|nr:outer membrane beta-barrel family protein [Christiangramia flava]APU69280.1 TonB-dependent receptor, putative [Christiangramia flava JLT2011]OSS38821.1 putative TonB-dependent receptor [Christiangramia flava JLT2011]